MFIITNMDRMPLLRSPTRKPVASSKLMTQVDDAWMPILCSMEPQATPLDGPREPSSATDTLGTRNRLMPRLPSGASGVRASTRWMMFSVRSCSPAEMKILVPVIV